MIKAFFRDKSFFLFGPWKFAKKHHIKINFCHNFYLNIEGFGQNIKGFCQNIEGFYQNIKGFAHSIKEVGQNIKKVDQNIQGFVKI